MSETRMLPVKLTEDELRERGAELAERVRKLSALEELRKDTAKAQKEEIDGVKDVVLDLSRVVGNREERRPVEVIERFDVAARLVLEVRTDTGEQISSRPMTLAEVEEHEQLRLKFVSQGNGEPKAAAVS